MATGEDDNNKEKESKGFAGLFSLVSDVDAMPPPVAKKPTASPTGTSSGASRPVPQAAPSKSQPTPQKPYKPPQKPGSGSSTGKWWIGIAVVVGSFWLIGQFNENTSTQAPAYSRSTQSTTPSYSSPVQPQVPSRPAQPKSSPVSTESDLMSDGDGAVYRVPSFRVAELENYKRYVKSAQHEAKNLEDQVERQKNQLDDERRQVDQAQRGLDKLGGWIERQRLLIDGTNQYEIDSFNSKVREYNSHRDRLQYQINNFNANVNAYNELLQRARIAEQSANQMVDGYNTKLEQYGTRQ